MSGGGKGSKKSSSTSTQTVEVPEYLERELRYGLSESRDLYDQGAPEFFPDQTYADLTPEQLQAIDLTKARATNGSPLVQGAQDLTQRTIEGEFLNSNPYLDQILDRYAAKANQQVLGSFNKSGRLGSGANVAVSQQAIADATLPFLFQNYENERGRQVQASQFAPSLADYDYRDIQALSSAGDILQAQDQLGIEDARARYEYNAEAPSKWLDQYLDRVNNSGANNLTTTTTNTVSKQKSGGGFGSVLGTALSIGSMFVPGGQFAALGSMGAGLGSAAGFGLSTGGQGLLSGGLTNAVNATRGYYGPGF